MVYMTQGKDSTIDPAYLANPQLAKSSSGGDCNCGDLEEQIVILTDEFENYKTSTNETLATIEVTIENLQSDVETLKTQTIDSTLDVNVTNENLIFTKEVID